MTFAYCSTCYFLFYAPHSHSFPILQSHILRNGVIFQFHRLMIWKPHSFSRAAKGSYTEQAFVIANLISEEQRLFKIQSLKSSVPCGSVIN